MSSKEFKLCKDEDYQGRAKTAPKPVSRKADFIAVGMAITVAVFAVIGIVSTMRHIFFYLKELLT